MSYLFQTRAFIFGIIFFSSPHLALSAELIHCGSLPSDKPCTFYRKLGQEKGTRIYAKPDKNSSVIYAEGLDFVVSVDTKAAKPYPAGWLPVVGLVPPKGDAHFAYRGWLPLDTVVDELSLKRVVGCWPYSKVEAELGDVMGNFRFDTAGNYIEESYGESDEKLEFKGHLFYGEGIVELRRGDKPYVDYFYFDSHTQVLTRFAGYGEVTISERFAPSLLQGCGSEPTVEDAPPTKANKPTIKSMGSDSEVSPQNPVAFQ